MISQKDEDGCGNIDLREGLFVSPKQLQQSHAASHFCCKGVITRVEAASWNLCVAGAIRHDRTNDLGRPREVEPNSP